MRDAWWILSNLVNVSWAPGRAIFPPGFLLPRSDVYIVVAAILLMWFVQKSHSRETMRHLFAEQPLWIRWSFYHALVYGTLFFGRFEAQQFLYFQF